MPIIQELPGLLKRGIRKYKVPGATLAVYRKGRVTETAAGAWASHTIRSLTMSSPVAVVLVVRSAVVTESVSGVVAGLLIRPLGPMVSVRMKTV